ncbi:hypothetical protein WA026_021825 [Henosepilachna vigintioctopunctata]|uniref:RNA-binding protein NOB1 n=1 Tax=Henosepilachna vigintioctopunctata TaxID=420089 RepID=A0AAW1UHH3_9CUCU
MNEKKKKIEYLVVDTSAFIQNVQLQNTAENVITCENVVNEITNKRQLKRLVVLPYDLQVKNVSSESIKVVTEFSIKTGDYKSLSATDIAVIALTYQLEKEKVGTDHLRNEPLYQKTVNFVTSRNQLSDLVPTMPGFYLPKEKNVTSVEEKIDNKGNEVHEGNDEDNEVYEENNDEDKVVNEENKLDECKSENLRTSESVEQCDIEVLKEKFESSLLFENCEENDDENDNLLQKCEEEYSTEDSEVEDDDDGGGWITPSNVKDIKKQMQGAELEDVNVKVACMTTDFAMQNVLKQMNLNVASLDGKMIKQLRTYVLRCYSCFKTTSIMTKQFCPKCGNNTLKKVSVSLDENGKMQIHINARKPLTARGKRISLPRIKGGKHPNNPILVEDQPMPDNRPSKLARIKNDPLSEDYIAGFSPFITRDVYSRSAMLGIRPNVAAKDWMKRNSNASRRKRK